jgi:two-component system, NarL family, nitrate/nitrite response regulator NarL
MGQNATPAGNGEKIRVLAADSTRMSSQLLAESLSQDRQFDVTGIEPKFSYILDAVAQKKPHVVLVSSTLENSATLGFDIARRVRAGHPQTKVVLLMDASTPGTVVEAFRSGAQGVFSRTESAKALARCICCVHQGQVWASSEELRYVLEALRESQPMRMLDARGEAILSKREQEVVRCVAEGLSNREIATRLKLTEHTVKNYLFRIFDKLGVSSRVEVVLYVFRTRTEAVGAPEIDRPHVSDPKPALVSQAVKPVARVVPNAGDPLRELPRRTRM